MRCASCMREASGGGMAMGRLRTLRPFPVSCRVTLGCLWRPIRSCAGRTPGPESESVPRRSCDSRPTAAKSRVVSRGADKARLPFGSGSTQPPARQQGDHCDRAQGCGPGARGFESRRSPRGIRAWERETERRYRGATVPAGSTCPCRANDPVVVLQQTAGSSALQPSSHRPTCAIARAPFGSGR